MYIAYLLFAILSSQSVTAITKSFNIYPVVGEVFSMSPGQLFDNLGMNDTLIINSSTPQPFQVTNYGNVINNNVAIQGTIISTAQDPQNGNPNLPTNKYSYLVQNSQGYQLYEVLLQTNGSLSIISTSASFNPPNTTCYTTEYILAGNNQNVPSAVCLTDIQILNSNNSTNNTNNNGTNNNGTNSSNITSVSSNVGIYYYIQNLTSDLLYISSNTQNNFNRSQVQYVQTQVTPSQNGYYQQYFSILCVMNGNQTNMLSVFEIIQLRYLSFIQNGYSYNFQIQSFYLASNLDLFILESNYLYVVNGIYYYSFITEYYNYYNYYNQPYTNLSVYYFYDFQQEYYAFYITLTGTSTISQLFYNPEQNYIQEYYFSNFSTPTPIQNVFSIPEFTVIITQNQILAWEWQYSTQNQTWNEFLPNSNFQTLSSFDIYNKILLWTLNNGTIQSIQFRQQVITTPIPVTSSTPNGNFTLIGVTTYGNIAINVSYFVVQNSNQAMVYQKTEFLPITQYYEPSVYFTGPDLNYSSSIQWQNNSYQLTLQQWSPQSINNQLNPINSTNLTNLSTIQNVKFAQPVYVQGNIYLVYQVSVNNTLQTYMSLCQDWNYYYCNSPVLINSISQPISKLVAGLITEQPYYYYYGTYQIEVVFVIFQQSPSIQIVQPQYENIIDLGTINIQTLYSFNGLNQIYVNTVASFAGTLFVVTASPSSLVAVDITYIQPQYYGEVGSFNYYEVGTSQYNNYAPQNIWIDEQDNLLLVDNVFELVVLQITSENTIAQVNNLTYPVQQYTQLIVGYLDNGLLLTFQINGGSQIYYYPISNLLTVSFTPLGYTTKPGTYNYTLSSLTASSDLFQYYVSGVTLLVYQVSSSSVGSFYTSYNFSSNIQSLYVQTQDYAQEDMITVLVDGTIQTMSLIQIPYIYSQSTALNEQNLVEKSTVFINVNSNANLNKSYSSPALVYCGENNYNITANTSKINSQLIVNDVSYDNSNFIWNHNYYPYPDFIGPIESVTAQYSNPNDYATGNLAQNNMVSAQQLSELYDAQAFYYSYQLGIIAQNLTGSYIMEDFNGHIYTQLLFQFPYSVSNCPYVGQYNSSLYFSVCTLTNFSSMIFFYSGTGSNSTIINLNNTVVNGSILDVSYSNGIFTFITQIPNYYNYYNSPNLAVCALKLNTNQQIYCELTTAFNYYMNNFQNIENIQILDPTSPQNLTQIFGIIVPMGYYTEFQVISVIDSSNSTYLNVSFTITNASNTVQEWVNQASAILNFVPNLVQAVQTKNVTQLDNSISLVPIFLSSDQGNFGINVYFNTTNFTNPMITDISLECGYGAYTGQYYYQYLTTSAVDDLIVSTYQTYYYSDQIVFVAYRSSNPIFGGDSSPVCQANKDESIPMVYYLGAVSMQMYANQNSQYQTILSNGQVILFQQYSYPVIIKLSPYYEYVGTLPNSDFNQIIPLSLTVSNQLYQQSYNIKLTVNEVPNTSTQGYNYKLLAIILGSVFGGIIVIGIVGFFIYRSKQQGNSDPSNTNNNNIEL